MRLSVEHLHVSYGGIKALQDVSLHIDAGEIVALIGANGAGKTTLLRTISGLLRPVRGNVTLDQRNVSSDTAADLAQSLSLKHLRADQIVRLGVSHVPEGRQIFSNLTVHENLMIGAHQRGDRAALPDDIAKIHEYFPVLSERKSQRAGTLSGGEQQMLAIGRALMARPKLLLLDEPSLGLAPLVVRTIFQIIAQINRAGTTIFLVEQNAHMALGAAHRAYVLQTGKILMTGKASDLLADPQVKKAYLGG